ncbi:AMP-binding protein [Amycolatopsis jejuensis]|uniref:AMP-binding protein n=1 Tax=Amycolatopsis jejuensis TaxID=330084 RepID=UPI000A0179CA|nr:AMP-binding protein [Amycolatopsis jejuensis]
MSAEVSTRFRLLGDVLAHWAEYRGDQPAITYQEITRTWAEFDARVQRLSAALAAAGIGRGDRVAFLDKNHPACVEVTFAAAALGAATAIVNWRLSGDELAYVLDDSGAQILFVGAEMLPAVELGRLPAVRDVVVVGGEEDRFEAFVAGGSRESGVDGRTGVAGESGVDGRAGVAGESEVDGRAGVAGESGAVGRAGAVGESGVVGQAGVAGESEVDGRAGAADAGEEAGRQSGVDGVERAGGALGAAGGTGAVGKTVDGAREEVVEDGGVSEDDGVLVMYTSGTTGFPKGAVLTHKSVLAHGVSVGTAFPFQPGDRNLVAMPLFHVGGSCYAVVGFLSGAPTIMIREPDAPSLFAALAAGATHAFLVPAVVAAIVQAGDKAMAAFSRLRYLGYGASPMPLPLLRTALAAWPDMNFVQVYGMTELSGAVTTLDPDAHRDPVRTERLASAGTPVPGVEVRIVDPVTLEDAATGEVWIRTDQRMAGYLGKPEATAETVIDGWVRTGDVGRLDDGGFLFLEDRVKDMIITGGENVYSPEVERVIAEFPGVGEVAVIGVPDDRWGEQVKAVVAPLSGETVDAGKLVEFCRERLAHYKCPRTVDVLEALPRNATGKILKRTLREPYWRDRERNV